MKYIFQSLWILYFYAMGLGVSMLIGGVIPGSILGMIFLFSALALGWLKEGQVDKVATLLLKYMIVFFLPASVGVMVAWDIIGTHIWAIIASATISTLLIIATVAIMQQKLGKRW